MEIVTVRFDEALPRLTEVITTELGAEALEQGRVLRDVEGRLAFFSQRDLDIATAERVTARIAEALGVYARPDRSLVLPSDLGADAVLNETSVLRFAVNERRIHLVDRRLVGADWLREPAGTAAPPPRFVFASLKGGVGRSTALSVVAAHLAATGRRVLAIDLDLEAPGLGAFLLDPETVPPFGAIDVLVEGNLTELDDGFFADVVASSSLADRAGRIDVLPALGRCSLDNPADVLAKLSRAYAEEVRSDGTVATVLDKVRGMVDRFADPTIYDAILVDVRAGLHETTASALIGLGAEVFLFGLDEPQTFQGYAALLAHLARLVKPGQAMPEWVERLTGVHAKASSDASDRSDFVERWRSLADEYGPRLRPATDEVVEQPERFHDPSWDEEQPDDVVLPQETSLHQPIAVLRDDRYERFDPLRRRDLLGEGIYRATFGQLVQRLEEAVAAFREEEA